MASFEDRVAALKSNAGQKNSRSPLNDPFYAESLIIQSKSIVGRMYSSNEYVRFKYECELNQLVKEYRVWLAEIKREEREITAKLDAMRLEQREIAKTRRDLEAIQLVAKTNREFLNHYKKRGIHKKNDRSEPQTTHHDTLGDEKNRLLLRLSQKCENFTSGKGNKTQKVLRLPKIVSKLDGVVPETKERQRRTSLPGISSQREKMKTETVTFERKREAYVTLSGTSRQPEHIKLVQDLLKTQQENENMADQLKNSLKPRKHKQTANSPAISLNVKSNIARSFTESAGIKKARRGEVFESLLDKDKTNTLSLSTVRQPRILSAPKSRTKDCESLLVAVRPSSAAATIS